MDFHLPIKESFKPILGQDEQKGRQTGQDAQNDVKADLHGVDQLVVGNIEGVNVAVDVPPHGGGDHRGHDHRAESRCVPFTENDLQGEKGARERSVEGGCDAPRGTGPEQGPRVVGGQFEDLGRVGPHRAADLGDRPFPPGGAPGTDADGGCEEPDENGSHLQDATPHDHRFHDLGDPLTLGFAREQAADGSCHESADGRKKGNQEDLQVPGGIPRKHPSPWDPEYLAEQGNQFDKAHGPEAAEQPDDDGQHQKNGVFAPESVHQGVVRRPDDHLHFLFHEAPIPRLRSWPGSSVDQHPFP